MGGEGVHRGAHWEKGRRVGIAVCIHVETEDGSGSCGMRRQRCISGVCVEAVAHRCRQHLTRSRFCAQIMTRALAHTEANHQALLETRLRAFLATAADIRWGGWCLVVEQVNGVAGRRL